LLCDSDLNRLREQRGKSPVNSLWLWGGGTATAAAAPHHAVAVVRENAFATAVTRAFGIPLEPDLSRALSEQRQRVLVAWCDLLNVARYDDYAAWCERLAVFDRDCLAPLLEALRLRRIARLTLHTGSGRFVAVPADRWRFWRRSRPLAEWL